MFNIGDRVVTPHFGEGVITEIYTDVIVNYLVVHNIAHRNLHNNSSENYKLHTCYWYYEEDLAKGDY